MCTFSFSSFLSPGMNADEMARAGAAIQVYDNVATEAVNDGSTIESLEPLTLQKPTGFLNFLFHIFAKEQKFKKNVLKKI